MQAVRFLNDNAFTTPTYFFQDDILRRIEVEGALRRVNQAQSSVLNQLLDDRRLERLIEHYALAAAKAEHYAPSEMLSDLRGGLWSELARSRVTIDASRRELQRSFINVARNKVQPPPFTLPPGVTLPQGFVVGPARATSDVRSLFRAELQAIDAQARGAVARSADPETRAHLDYVRAEIDRILNPN